ncbi:uncharacterized protein LOC125664485 isoform X2 [Ostrea edulis]|uniref:uncharacterized protein LOC125664485 isoform X2 n=1 Tax=Ostrea edulis TaxID=37623 RepID=UPI0024AEEBA4|nr:uncharacterized protein LOC125664485 isoform X2 [Ostrea edulis]
MDGIFFVIFLTFVCQSVTWDPNMYQEYVVSVIFYTKTDVQNVKQEQQVRTVVKHVLMVITADVVWNSVLQIAKEYATRSTDDAQNAERFARNDTKRFGGVVARFGTSIYTTHVFSYRVHSILGMCCTDYILHKNRCIECEAGTYGVNCSETCPDGYYGRRCKEQCSADCKGICNKVNGRCPVVEETRERVTHSVLIERGQEGDELMNNVNPGLLASPSIQSVVIVLSLVAIVYIAYNLRRLHGAIARNYAQIKSLYVLATQGQGQLVLYTGLRLQTTYQGNSGEDQTDYILPISAEP